MATLPNFLNGNLASSILLDGLIESNPLSFIKSIEATIEIIDVEMGKDPWYLTVGKTPLEKVHKLLSKLHSIRVSKDRGSLVSTAADDLFYNFIEQVESIFKNLYKPLKWLYFLLNDLILLTDIPSKVQKASIKHSLNKVQTKALARLEQVSDKIFHEVTQKALICQIFKNLFKI